MSDFVIGIVGNPNCGKTTFFNALTGAKQRVGNWPGVTVERKVGVYRYGGMDIEVVDLPGIYSLDVTSGATSLDEKVARDYILSREADLIVNIVDASNLERNLYLTAQLLEMQVPMVVALNMMDIAKDRGIRIDVPGLAERLDCPVIPLVASRNEGIEAVKAAINQAAEAKRIPTSVVGYPAAMEEAVAQLLPHVADKARDEKLDPRWLAVKLIEGDSLASRLVGEQTQSVAVRLCATIEERTGEEADILIADSRYGFINALARATLVKTTRVSRTLSDRIDRVMLNRALGIPLFLGVMYLMFMFTIHIGGAFIDFFDQLAGTLFVDGFGALLSALGSPDWLTTLLAEGIGGGVQVVATFIPIIGFLYLFLSALEDSGYMARAAFVMDRFMRLIGLPGKSFVPMIVGFGCNVPAIMATRTLEQERDRILTILMNPFMSCGARLPVYALFAAAFFPAGGQNLVFGLYLIGIAFAVLTGLVMKHTLLKGEVSPFVMELPPYHVPTARGVLLRAWDRLKAFMFRAGRVIVPMVLVINFLNAWGTDGSFDSENTDRSVLSEVGRVMTPAFAPMGIQEDNWPATVGVFTGVLAKEVVVGTLDAIYSKLARGEGEPLAESGLDLWGGIREAFATIPANLVEVLNRVTDPLGLDIGDVSSREAAATEQGVAAGTFGEMVSRFDGKIGAFAYLLFVLLYFPCVSATAAIYRELAPGWTVFVAAWTTGLAYTAATLFYQAATFSRHPLSSAAWIVGLLSLFALVIVGFRYWGARQPEAVGLPGKA